MISKKLQETEHLILVILTLLKTLAFINKYFNDLLVNFPIKNTVKESVYINRSH